MRNEHLAEEILQQYVDGELTDGKAGDVRQHLEACWRCRTRHQETVQTIGEFVRYFERANDTSPHWPDLAPMLDRALAAKGEPERPAFLRWRWAIGTLAVAGFAGTAWYWPRPNIVPPLSAPPVATAPLKEIPKAATPTAPTPPQASADLPVELYILAALYDTGADLGGGVEYRRSSPGKYSVSFPPMDGAQEASLVERLRRIPGVTVVFPRADAAAVGAAVIEGTVQGGREPDSRLLAAAGSRKALEKLSNSILDRSDAILLRAQALQRIDHAEFGRLAAQDADVLARIRDGHREAFRRDCLEQKEALQRLLQRFGQPDNSRRTGTIVMLAQAADDALHALLAGAPSDLSTEQLAAKVSSAIESSCAQ